MAPLNARQRFLLVTVVLATLTAFIVWRVELQRPSPPRPRTAEEVEREYSALVAQFRADPEVIGSALSSDEPILQSPHFKGMVALGRPAVPLAIRDLIADKHNYYATCLLDELLPEVDLARLYGDPECTRDSNKHRETWLRWWNEHGSRMNWEP